jgi:hypothetical protein
LGRKTVLAAAAAVIAACSMTVFAGARDLAPRASFADRFVVLAASAPDCIVQGWPYLDSRCLRREDGAAPVRPIRIIAIDRISR